MNWFESIKSLPSPLRICLIVLLALTAHVLVRAIRKTSEWLLAPRPTPDRSARENLARRYPRFATILTILVSALTFSIYFAAFGLILLEFRVPFKTYFASATILGLAIGFGLQGFVQDIVIGLTLIFSDALNLGDLVELSGQIGKVENIGLRFTTLVNLYGQNIFVPNRNIATIGRFRAGAIRAYVDLQIPDNLDENKLQKEIEHVARGLYKQHRALILSPPENLGLKSADPGSWRYLRLKCRLWPGQGALLETIFKQRALALLKSYKPDYPDWMIAVTYRAE